MLLLAGWLRIKMFPSGKSFLVHFALMTEAKEKRIFKQSSFNPLRGQENTPVRLKRLSKSRSVNVFLETVMDNAELRLSGALCQSLKGRQQLRNVQKYIRNISCRHFRIFL